MKLRTVCNTFILVLKNVNEKNKKYTLPGFQLLTYKMLKCRMMYSKAYIYEFAACGIHSLCQTLLSPCVLISVEQTLNIGETCSCVGCQALI